LVAGEPRGELDGKRTFFLERIELAVASFEFHHKLKRSARRRKLSNEQVAAIEKFRSETAGAVRLWRDSEAAAPTRAHPSAAPAPTHLPVSLDSGNDTLARRLDRISKQELDMAEEFRFCGPWRA